MYVERPNNFFAFCKEYSTEGYLGSKLKIENVLKRSGINYTIIRPGKLSGEKSFSNTDF